VNLLGVRHRLEDHLRGTAELAAGFAQPFGSGRLARWLGLLHDVGKASCEWQQRLLEVEGSGQPVGRDHKLLGVRLASERGLGKLAMAIDGHHGGLTSPSEVRRRLVGVSEEDARVQEKALSVVRGLLPELASTGRVDVPDSWLRQSNVAEVGLRLLFSALCDADFLDTAAHFAGRSTPILRPEADFIALRDRFEHARQVMIARRKPSQMDDARERVYRECVAAAARPRGVFRLAAPTGSGKTIAGAGFAVHHAALQGISRVIVAVPFLTITEQNAGVYRKLLNDGSDEVVLEHHSAVDFDRSGRKWARLAAENWDAPFVVTTMVRLFESLFDRRPAAMRRLHRLAGSVIVLDEIQALPHALLVPILDVLRTLVDHFGMTILLSSATQPDFWSLSPFHQLAAHDVIGDAQALVTTLRRVDFEWWNDPKPTLVEVADAATGHRQTMVVVNTTADARTVFDRWSGSVPSDIVWHLSTRMCAAHRRRVLESVRERLKASEPVLLVSTQLIEAGVDVDFPIVYRIMAPADSLLQAAGRANRDGNLPGEGKVIIVEACDAGQPPAYRTLVDNTRLFFGPGKADPDDLDALGAYYRAVYGALNLEHPESLGMRIQAARGIFDFHTVTDGPLDPATNRRDYRYAFRMISETGLTVVTPQAATDDVELGEIEDVIERIRTAPQPVLGDIRRLQPYMTSIHSSALRQPGVIAQLRPILGSPEAGDPSSWNGVLAEWVGGYDPHCGIELDPRIEEFVA
jgi:uncharacterized domain HDIG